MDTNFVFVAGGSADGKADGSKVGNLIDGLYVG